MPDAIETATGASAALRRHPLAGRHAGSGVVTLTPAESAARVSLRAGEDAVAALSSALGLELPRRPKTSAAKDGRAALWLGPDEWLVIDTAGGDPMADCGKADALHSAVDVSHRNTAILVSGPGAEATLSAGCPQDLSLPTFPVDACSRTVLGKVEVVLWRTDRDTFRVEVWRSFSDYAFTFLATAARDAAL